MNSQWINKIYQDAQKSCNLNIGDWVKIIDILKDDDPWYCSDMDKTIGTIGKINNISYCGISVYLTELRRAIYYPYFALEKTERPCPFKIGDYVKVLGQGPMKFDTIVEGKFPIWNKGMNSTIGTAGIVESIPSEECRFKDTVLVRFPNGDKWQYAFDCLEKMDKPVYEFKPFEPVLARDHKTDKWQPQFYSHYKKGSLEPYAMIGGQCWRQCIPYAGNEHLCGTTTLPKN